jgi:hypothetical protein
MNEVKKKADFKLCFSKKRRRERRVISHEKGFLSDGREYVDRRVAAHIALRFWVHKGWVFDFSQHDPGGCIDPGEYENPV